MGPLTKIGKTLGLAPLPMFDEMQSSACKFLGGASRVSHAARKSRLGSANGHDCYGENIFTFIALLGSVNVNTTSIAKKSCGSPEESSRPFSYEVSPNLAFSTSFFLPISL
jgi:hypothetical protein